MSSHSFSGAISSITFVNTTTSVPDKMFVDMGGPSSTITFENSTLTKITGQAFARSRLKRLEFRGCSIGQLQPNAISPNQLSVLQLTDCSFDSLQPAALSLSLQTLNITRCRFAEVATSALAVRWSGKAWLHNNTFEKASGGAFSRLIPTDGSSRLEFHDNRLLVLDQGTLNFSAHLSPDQLTVRRLRTQEICRCHLPDWVHLMSGGTNATNTSDWLVKRLVAALHCLASPSGRDTNFLNFHHRECGPDEPQPSPPSAWKPYIVGVAAAAALVTVVCAAACFIVWLQSRRRRRHHQHRAAADDALRHRPHKLNNANLYTDGASSDAGSGGGWDEPPESPRRPLVVAVPDVKTYTETEVHVVLETLESMEPTVLPRTPSSGTLQRLREGARRPTVGHTPETGEPQSPGCRKSCPL